jgi:hypothetical protein
MSASIGNAEEVIGSDWLRPFPNALMVTRE